MAANGEIIVRPDELMVSAGKLSALSKSIVNRRLKLNFSESRGEMVDKLNAAAEELNTMCTVVSELIQKIEGAVTYTAVAFERADNWEKYWGSTVEP